MELKIDTKDKILLYELSNNSRVSFKQLSSILKLSIQSVSRRITKLYESNIIINTYPIIDYSVLGFKGYRVYFNFFNTNSYEENEILKWLHDHPCVSVLAEAFGSIDVVIMSWVRERSLFLDFVLEFKDLFGDKIEGVEIFTYLKTYHFPRDYLVEKKNRKFTNNMIETGNEERGIYNLDSLDIKILSSIKENARKTNKEVSKEISVPVKTIAYRIKRLEKQGVILGYGANINISKIGFEYFKLNFIFRKRVDFSKLIRFSSGLVNSVYVDRTIGKYDFELNLEIKDKRELYAILSELKDMVGGFRKMDVFQIKKYWKISYVSI